MPSREIALVVRRVCVRTEEATTASNLHFKLRFLPSFYIYISEIWYFYFLLSSMHSSTRIRDACVHSSAYIFFPFQCCRFTVKLASINVCLVSEMKQKHKKSGSVGTILAHGFDISSMVHLETFL